MRCTNVVQLWTRVKSEFEPSSAINCVAWKWFLWSGKVRKKLEDQKKSGNLTFHSQGKIKGSGKVRENQSTRVQKLTKMQEKIWTVVRRLRTMVQNFFLFTSLADYFYVHFWICYSTLVSSVIASDWKLTLVFCMNKLVRESDLFCPGKVRENEFCKVVGTMMQVISEINMVVMVI